MIRISEDVKDDSFVADPALHRVSNALRLRSVAFDVYGADSPEYVTADGALCVAKEQLRWVRDGR